MKFKRRIALAFALAAMLAPAGSVAAQDQPPLKVGLMLPYSGMYLKLGEMIDDGFRLYVKQQGGKLAGRSLDYVKLDDESDPARATDNVNKLIKRDKVDVLVGTVHSGVAQAMAKAANDSKTLLIVPNAGASLITGPMCSMNIVRTSFDNWQPGYAMGVVAAERGWKTAMTVTWNYAAGHESVQGFSDGFTKGGGKVVKDLKLPFPNVEFQALLTEIAAQKPDVVYTFFAGNGAVKFVKDYVAAGLKDKVPLVGAGFLTDGLLPAQGDAAEGLLTALYYADDLDTERDNAFREAFLQEYGEEPDVYAVQGYDAAQVLHIGLTAVDGDMSRSADMQAAMRAATIHSPRGDFTLAPSGNPVQDMYLREVRDGKNVVISTAVKALAAPAKGCRLQ